MEVAVYDIKGNKTEKNISLHDSIYKREPNDHAIYLDVKRFLSSQRQGTHKSKQRNEIAGSTKKLHRQKGTGNARRGNIKSPLLRGGGRVHGPQPRNYSFKLNKKVTKLARISALSYKAKADSITILEDFTLQEPKTKSFAEILNNFALYGEKTLLILPKPDRNILLASRNLKEAKVVLSSSLNTYDILNARKVLIAESSVKEIENLLLKK